MVAIAPIADESGNVIGVIRLIGPENNLRLLKFDKDAEGFRSDHTMDRTSLMIPDPDLIPHVLGRWSGSFYNHDDPIKVVTLLLNCFSSFFPKCHNMYYGRDFDNDFLQFLVSTSSGTQHIINGLKASIYDHTYMFSIVAERGASEIVANFPEDLPLDLRLNYTQWSPNDYFIRLKQSLGVAKTSYIGIPLKVDDAVIGVFALVAAQGNDRFSQAARFMRSTLSEMGRTVDKKAMTKSSEIIRSLRADSSLLTNSENTVHSLSKRLVEALVKQLVPYGSLIVDFVEARFGGTTQKIERAPKKVSDYLQGAIPDLVVSETITFYIFSDRKANSPITAIIVIPIISALPFVVYIYGPMALLTGRTLCTALEQLQATFNLSLAAAERSENSNFQLSSWRGHLALWAKIHELKNRTAGFAKPLRELVAVSYNGDLNDLRQEILRFKEDFSSAIETFELECNDILRGTSFRTIKAEPLIVIIRRTLTILSQFPHLRSQVTINAVGNLNVNLKTYSAELELVLKDLIRNILQHFDRERQVGGILIEIYPKTNNRLELRLADTISASAEIAKVCKILDDPDSRNSLRRHVKPTVEKLLQGAIYAIPHPKFKSVCMVLDLPVEVIAY